jgi:hypothetical protein
VAAKIKELRAAAKITYMGDFVKTEDAAAPAAEAAPAAIPATAPAAPAAEADKSASEKGVAGLK